MTNEAAITPRPVFVTYPELPNYGVPAYTRVHLMRLMRGATFRNKFS